MISFLYDFCSLKMEGQKVADVLVMLQDQEALVLQVGVAVGVTLHVIILMQVRIKD